MITKIDSALFAKMVKAAKVTLANNRDELNALNVFPVPDGDTGTNMTMTFTSAASVADNYPDSVSDIIDGVSMAALRGARGNSGVILSQLLRGMSKGMKGCKEVGIDELEQAFVMGTKTAYGAIMKPTEGTILTVFRLMSEHITEHKDEYEDVVSLMRDAKEAAYNALMQTPEMLPKLKQAGVVDSGGKGVYYIIAGMADFLENGVMPEEVEQTGEEKGVQEREEDITFTYCTEFIIQNKERKKNSLAKIYEKLGDCVVVVADEDIIKVHIHTDNPGVVISEALKIGSLINIKIDNMRYQNELLDAKNKENNEEVKKERVPYAFVAVATGEGFINIYNELGIENIVSGGQSMNPSAEDILNVANKANADVVYVFPNNKNIILAAQQASEMYEGKMIVIPTKNMSDVFPCMVSFDENADADMNLASMIEVLDGLKSGQVTYAVRDSVFDNVEIKEGEIMGLCGSAITAKGKDINKVTLDLIGKLVDKNSEMVTVYAGKDISSESMEELEKMCQKKHKNTEFVFYRGDQPVYYYLVSVE